MLNHELELDVQIFDTDCFGVMWHGAYVKWLELGRVRLFESVGLFLSKPEDESGYIYPVVDQHFRFKSPARMRDKLTLKTSVAVEGHKLVFQQEFYNHQTGKVTLQAQTICVVLDFDWKTQRRLPEEVSQKLSATASV